MAAYYNEFDPYAAQWLRNLIAAGHIAPGDIDERDIRTISADDLKGYAQCHFFAGIGGWSYALRLAGWPDDRPVWTGSCPCQPFSSAGKQKGHGDERHLWPYWAGLIRQHRPSEIFGEQVAGAIAFGWLDEVFIDLEKEAYSCASAVLPACSVKAPHRRDRLWFVARDSQSKREATVSRICEGKDTDNIGICNDVSYAASKQNGWLPRRGLFGQSFDEASPDTINLGYKGSISQEIQGKPREPRELERGTEDFNNGWSISEPKICGVDDGIPARTPKLRAYGNAIVPQVAAEFIKAAM